MEFCKEEEEEEEVREEGGGFSCSAREGKSVDCARRCRAGLITLGCLNCHTCVSMCARVCVYGENNTL